MKITKKFTAEAAHIVAGAFSTKCQNLHGHSYTIEVTLSGHKLDDSWMLVDFSVLKGPIKEFIESIDHSYMINSYAPKDQIDFIQSITNRWVTMPFNATAEMMAVWFHRMIQYILDHTEYNYGGGKIVVESVKVWETATGCAESSITDIQTIWNDLWIPMIGFSENIVKDWSKDLKNLLFGSDPDYKIKIKAPKYPYCTK